MSDVRKEAERQLEAVRRDFEGRLGNMLEEIELAWNSVQTTSDLVLTLKALTEQVHRLAGNAGFFGLTNVSRSASKLEQALERAAHGVLNEEGFHELNQLVEFLKMHRCNSH